VRVYGVFDKGWHDASVWSAHQKLLDAGGNVRMDGNENFDPHNPYHGSKIHDKIMTIDAGYDNAVTLTGSFNFSPSAAVQGNDENCILIYNKAISIRYRTELEKLYRWGTHPAKAQGGDTANFLNVIISEIGWAGSKAAKIDADPGANPPVAGVAQKRILNDKFVELQNRTSKTIDISGWQLWGTCSSTYRMLGHIFPRGTKIPPGGYHILGRSHLESAYEWNEHWSAYEYLGTMHDSGRQNYIYLRLKDVDGKFIDIAGQRGTAPFAGDQGAGVQPFISMRRIGLDGTSPANWATTTQAQAALSSLVKGNFTSQTWAAPGVQKTELMP
jgi:hypothetical protein